MPPVAPWQKLGAIYTFIQLCLTYGLRAGNLLKNSLIKYRRKLVAVVRPICNLPLRVTSHFIFASRKVGGLVLQDHTAEVHIQVIVHALKMLSSSDLFIASVARCELLQTISYAAQDNLCL